MAGRLVNKHVLITGASGTIGAAVADAVAAAGGTPIRSDLADRTRDLVLDVTAEQGWRDALAAIEAKHGKLDGLVNSAGIAALGTIEETDYAAYQRVMAINVDGTFLGCKYAMPLMRRQGGSIVNLSSISGIVGGHNLAAYNASKGAVRLLTKSVALAGARYKPPVRCNSVHPAFVEGDMVDRMLEQTASPSGALVRITRDIPLGRLATPREVADMIVYLLSDESAFVTGAEFVIDGGLSAR